MNNLYHWCCKITCYMGLALAGNTIAINIATAQTTAPANDGYTPLNVGTIIPNGNTYYRDDRKKTVDATDVPDAENRLPDHVNLNDLTVTPANGGVEIKWRTTWEHVSLNARDKVFYRVRIVDANGKYEYSPVIAVQANNTTQNYVFPTIVNAGNVSMILNDDSYRIVQIVNMQGRILQTEQLSGRTGRIDILLSKSATGICIVRVVGTDPQKSIVQKIFINS
jgi:hypothetical protein